MALIEFTMEAYETGTVLKEDVEVPMWEQFTEHQKHVRLMEWASGYYSLRYTVLREGDDD